MQLNKAGSSMRFFFLVLGLLILLGIYLTGFSVVHWFSYVPVVFMFFAAITGICPGLIISKSIFGDK